MSLNDPWTGNDIKIAAKIFQQFFALLGTIEFNDRFAKTSVNYVKNDNSKWTQSMINVLQLMLV